MEPIITIDGNSVMKGENTVGYLNRLAGEWYFHPASMRDSFSLADLDDISILLRAKSMERAQ